MEIREYMRVKRRWLALLVVVPIVAAAVTAGLAANRPPESSAVVKLQVPVSLRDSDSQIGLYIARFDEAFNLLDVRQQITRETQLRPTEVASVAVARRGQSDQFTVALTTTAGEQRTLAGAETAAKIGSAWVAEQAAIGSQELARVAQSEYDKAQRELFAYQDEIDNLDPSVTYASVSRSLLEAPADGALRARAGVLVPQVRRFNELKAAVAAANSILGSAEGDAANDRAQVDSARGGQPILESTVESEGALSRIVEAAAVTMVGAFLFVLGLSLLPDLFRRQRRTGRPAAAATSGPVPPDPAPTTLGRHAEHPPDRQDLVSNGRAARASGPDDRPLVTEGES